MPTDVLETSRLELHLAPMELISIELMEIPLLNQEAIERKRRILGDEHHLLHRIEPEM